MFTGIVEQKLEILATRDQDGLRQLTVATAWPDVRLGESIALNGVCLTVAAMENARLMFDVIPETLDRTNLGRLTPGSHVNAERSLRVGDRLDGHFVQGHVDGVAKILQCPDDRNDWRLTLEIPPSLYRFLVPKGSVTLDGVSLTIASIGKAEFDVALIPTTLNMTTLGSLEVGWPINLECDVLSKTIVSWLERREAAREDGR